MLPVNASSEEMVIFTNRVLNNVVDAKGAKPTDLHLIALLQDL